MATTTNQCILVALDNSRFSHIVFEYALTRAISQSISMRAITVIASGNSSRENLEKYNYELAKYYMDLRSKKANRYSIFSYSIIKGDTVAEIIHASKSKEVTSVIIGAIGEHHMDSDGPLGRNVIKLLSHISKDIEVVKPIHKA